MRLRLSRPRIDAAVAAVLVAGTLVISTAAPRAAAAPTALTDQDFWRLVTELSEPGGVFPQQLMSNEDSAQFVVPALKDRPKGGVYLGVGSEQNFTYFSAVQPTLAFIFDIRRDNLVEHLMYKALFELSSDRADFVSRLFSRRRPAGLDRSANAAAIFDAYATADPDAALYDDTLHAVLDRLTRVHGFPLSDPDRAALTRMFAAFRTAGPGELKGYGDMSNLTYAQLMSATDLTGHEQGYLATEEHFRIVADLERQNLVVPLVGDFAGDKAIVGVGRYLKTQGATVSTFYVSNVERYLFEQGDHGRHFYANVATLPLTDSSTFIRSVTTDISRRLGIPIPNGPERWRTFLFPIRECLTAIESGRIATYDQIFEIATPRGQPAAR